MTEQRTVAQNVLLISAFATRVAALTPEAWDRLGRRCASLNRPSFQALLGRARLRSNAQMLLPLSLPPAEGRRPLPAVLLTGAGRAAIRGMAIAFELANEFDTPAAPKPRTGTTGKPRVDALIDARFLIDAALWPRQQSQPGLVAAMHAAEEALLRYTWLPPDTFAAVYEVVEPEIPLQELLAL